MLSERKRKRKIFLDLPKWVSPSSPCNIIINSSFSFSPNVFLIANKQRIFTFFAFLFIHVCAIFPGQPYARNFKYLCKDLITFQILKRPNAKTFTIPCIYCIQMQRCTKLAPCINPTKCKELLSPCN